MEEKNREMAGVRPILKKLLIAAIVIYVVASCIIQADLQHRVGEIEHKLVHISCEHSQHN